MLKFGRILRLNKIIQYLNVTEDVKASMKLTKIIFFLVIYIHVFACLWWFIVVKDKKWIPPVRFMSKDLYYIYKDSTSIYSNYLLSLHVSVNGLLGGDLLPNDSFQTIVASIAVFLGAIINANIFGELAMILASMDHEEKNFQSFFSASNTAMINLDLPSEVQQKVRDSHIKN